MINHNAPKLVPTLENQFSLSAEDKSVLNFEAQDWPNVTVKENAIDSQLKLSVTRYYLTLNSLIENPEAIKYDPILLSRLLRLRDNRDRNRNHRLGSDNLN